MLNELHEHQKADRIKWIVTLVVILLLIGGLVGCIVALTRPPKKETPPDPGCQLHVFKNGRCTACGIKEADAHYTMDVVTNDCAIKIYANDTFRIESFGAGINGYTVANLYDNTVVHATSNFSATTKVNVYKCTYDKYGEFIGYPKDDTTILLEGRAYNKELVYTLSVIKPIYEIREKADCLYIFELVKEEQA